MTKIVGVRFRHAGRIYYFAPGEFEITPGMNVIVMTARGIEYGTAVSGIREIEDDKVPQGLRPIQRIATEEDTEKAIANREKEREALAVCKEKIRTHGLDMKLIDAEYTFDNNKILFYFTADGRVDFRELVKDLAGVFRTRIELRQIGVRDETKILGGIGICGRPLCCHSYLSDFIPVSIKMAKEQNLSLNPTKISGVCGRLMCCLKNEEATYQYLNSRLPRIGEYVSTVTGLRGEVSEVNVLRQKVKIVVDMDGEKEIQEYAVEDLKIRPRKNRDGQNQDKSGAGNADGSQPENAGGHAGENGAGEKNRRDGQRRDDGGRRRGGKRGGNANNNGGNANNSANANNSGNNGGSDKGVKKPQNEAKAQSDTASEKRHQRRRHQKPAGQADNQKPAGQADNQKPAGQADHQKPAGQADHQKPAGQAEQHE